MKLARLSLFGLVAISLASTASCAPPMPGKTADAAPKSVAEAPAAPAPAPTQPGVPLTAEALKAKLNQRMPELGLEKITPSAIPGLFEVQRGSLFGYVTADGRYLISGDLVNLETGEELTENSRRQLRVEMLAKLGDQYIEFDPPAGKAQNVVTAFIDVDCGYCRKLHDEMASYNAQGIGLRYVFFPRAGLGSDSERQLDAVWCSADRKSALTRAVNGEKFAAAACATPTKTHYETGLRMGVHGTPMLILPNGEVVNGYVPADRLASILVASTLPPSPAASVSAAMPANP